MANVCWIDYTLPTFSNTVNTPFPKLLVTGVELFKPKPEYFRHLVVRDCGQVQFPATQMYEHVHMYPEFQLRDETIEWLTKNIRSPFYFYFERDTNWFTFYFTNPKEATWFAMGNPLD